MLDIRDRSVHKASGDSELLKVLDQKIKTAVKGSKTDFHYKTFSLIATDIRKAWHKVHGNASRQSAANTNFVDMVFN